MTSARTRRRRRIRERARESLAILPSMLTLGNMLCGFYAIVHVAAVQWAPGGAPQEAHERAFLHAAVAILLAMVFDMLDGRVARMTRTTSDFGGQLDSLADAISFGVAPAVMVAMFNSLGRAPAEWPLSGAMTWAFWAKMAWVLGAVYACGAVIRLARFNTETTSHSEDAHRWFKGLPSPAAAGVIASLVLLFYYGQSDRSAWITQRAVIQNIPYVLPFVACGAGYLMVSKFRYVHAANVFLRGRKPFEYLTGVVFGGALFALFPEVMLALLFCGFALTGPIAAFYHWMRPGAAPQAAPAAPVTSLPGAPPAPSPTARPGGAPDPAPQTH